MAKKSLIAKANRKPKFAVRAYTRCKRCGRDGECFVSIPNGSAAYLDEHEPRRFVAKTFF